MRHRGHENAEVIRQWKLLRTLEAARHGATDKQLARELDVTTRTTWRDMQALQDRLFQGICFVPNRPRGVTNFPDKDADVQWFRTFVDSSRWRFARTYVESFPHEFTLQRWVDGDAFWRAVLCIERWGAVEAFYSSRRKYMYVDDRKYWHMGNPASEKPEEHPTLINRTWLDVARYRDEAAGLGHDGEALEQLVERWKKLLARARGNA